MQKNNIPYFIRLCACDTVSGNVREWHERLRDIDEHINFNRAYAYNLKNKKFNGVEDIPSLILLDEDFSMN